MHNRSVLSLMLALLLIVFGGAVASAADRTITVTFPRGASGTTVSGSIKGDSTLRYVVGVVAGQRMSLQLDSSNSSNYFNVTAPGASEALFIGSIAGTSATIDIPSTGNYTITTYLTRNAARRGETANFKLTLYVESASSATPPPNRPDFADGLAGGPDFWQVVGLSVGDTLSVRSSASATAKVVGRLRNGEVLSNRGCTLNGASRWCRIRTRAGLSGWVAGRYLREYSGQPPAITLPTPPPVRPLPPQVSIPDAADLGLMRLFCRGAAAGKFSVRPQDVTVNMPFVSGSQYVAQGWVDHGGTKFFNCWFDLSGRFRFLS